MVKVQEKLEEGWIQCRVLLEMIGKPKEHVEKAIKNVVENIKKDEEMIIVDEHIAEIKKKDTDAKEDGLIKEMWATFAEVEILFKDLTKITYFSFEYMPSSIEILEPQNLQLRAIELSEFFNDLQARLHEVNMIAKQLKSRQMFLEKNFGGLLNNMIALVLGDREMTSEELSNVTKVNKEAIEDFLDKLIDDNKVEMVGEKYRRVLDGGKKSS